MFAKSLIIMQGMEAADSNAKSLKGTETLPKQNMSWKCHQRRSCFHCGRTNQELDDLLLCKSSDGHKPSKKVWEKMKSIDNVGFN